MHIVAVHVLVIAELLLYMLPLQSEFFHDKKQQLKNTFIPVSPVPDGRHNSFILEAESDDED